MSLLFAEQPIVINTPLAKAIGLNEAIVLQQVHYWIDGNKKRKINFKNGRYWTYNTYEKWQQDNFPFWSTRTVERVFKKLEDSRLVISGSFNQSKTDRTKWYTVNYEQLEYIEKSLNEASRQDDEMHNDASRQNDGMDNDASRQNGEMQSATLAEPSCQSGGLIPETTTEGSSKTTFISSSSQDSIDSELREQFPDKPFDLVKEILLADPKAIIETDAQYRSMLTYRLKHYIPSKNRPRNKPGKQNPIRTEILQDWHDEFEKEKKLADDKKKIDSDKTPEEKQKEIADILADFKTSTGV